MILTCWLGVHQWRVDHYTEPFGQALAIIERVSCARCGLLRSKADVTDQPWMQISPGFDSTREAYDWLGDE